jgi:phosphoribosylformylglycinamidine synthase
VYYVGAKTGRDGIHGATMASAEFDERSAEKRPAVQVGDPFMEKLLLEACLELMKTDALVGVQDMGAAGLTCSTCEMGARGGSGIEIDVALVPQRETGMTPYEIMLSESQERMLLVAKAGREREVEQVFEKWDLHAVRIGRVTTDGILRVRNHGELVAEVPNRALADEAPLYRRPETVPEYLKQVRAFTPGDLQVRATPRETLQTLLASPAIANKRWVYRQYDSTVRTNTVLPIGETAGVVRIKGTRKALAVSVDGNGRYCYLDPHRGAMLAVAEAARNVAVAGAVPIGVTNCLNFGNPERPEIMWQFARAVEGIAEACRALSIPVTGGNVSLYNETDGRAIDPTPIIGVVGLIEDVRHVVPRTFRGSGDAIVLLGTGRSELGGSEYLKIVHGHVRGEPPSLDLDAERRLQLLLVELSRTGALRSAHDASDGGIAVALAEACFADGTGAVVALPRGTDGHEPFGTLFGESASRAVISVAASDLDAVIAQAGAAGVPAAAIGRTGGDRLTIDIDGRHVVDAGIGELRLIWETAIERHFATRAA